MPENVYGSAGMNKGQGGLGLSADSAPASADPFDGADNAAGTGFEASGRRLLPGWVLKLLLFGLLAFAALGIARCRDKDEGYARVADISPSGRSASRISPEASPAYREQLNVYSERKAEEAMQKEDSFVAPAIGGTVRVKKEQGPVLNTQPAAEDKKPEPAAESKPVLHERTPPAKGSVRTENVKTKRSGPDDDGQQKKRMLQYLGALRQQKLPARGATLFLGRPSDSAASAQKQEAVSDVSLSATGLPGMRVGDILLAVNRVTLDSDAPGPAMAEIVLGPWKGARAVGSFVRHGENLVLSFTELVTQSGESLSIQACAIDPATDRTAVRSSVDTHALERFGGLIAASFLEGFGDAARRSGTSTYSSIYGSGSSTPRYSLSEEAWIAGGKVGERLGRQMEKNFDMAPTVVLKSGTEMGILLLRTAQRKEAGTALADVQEKKNKAGLVIR